MSNKNYLTIVLIIAILLGGVAFLVWKQVQTDQASPALNSFAKCLTSKNIAMYGTDSCSWCQKQKADFKSAWQYVTYVNCFNDPNKCLAQKIEDTPTWIFPDGKRLVGYQKFDVLSRETGCKL